MEDKNIKTFSELNIFQKVYIRNLRSIHFISYIILICAFILNKTIFSWIYKALYDKYYIIQFLGRFGDGKLEEKKNIINLMELTNKIYILSGYIICFIFIIWIIFFFKKVFMIFNLNKIINKKLINAVQTTETKYINYFKKYPKDILNREWLLYYEFVYAILNLKPSEFIKLYENKLENNDFYAFKNINKKINCVFNIKVWYGVVCALNKIILEKEVKFYTESFDKVLSIEFKDNKKIFFNISLALSKIVVYYYKKEYENLYILLKKYYEMYPYSLIKLLLVFLYISAEKTGNSLDFLPEITKQKMNEIIKEDEFKKFVEKELN